MILVALDPGKTTGISYLATESKRQGIIAHQEIGLCNVYNTLEDYQPDIVVYERFTQRFTAASYDPIEVIGVIKLWCAQYPATCFPQTSAQAKAFWTNDKLKKVGVYTPGQQHANDATRHLLRYYTDELGKDDFIRRLK